MLVTALLVWLGGAIAIVVIVSLLFTANNLILLADDDIGTLLLLAAIVVWPITLAYILIGCCWLLTNWIIKKVKSLCHKHQSDCERSS